MTDQTIAAPAPSKIIGYSLAAAGAALFSSKAIFIKLAYLERSDASLMLACRMAFSLPFFVIIGLYAFNARRRAGLPPPSARALGFAAVNGFIGYYIASYLDFAGLLFITAQLERLVLFTYPVFVMLLGFMFFKGRITSSGIIAALITYAGLALVFANGITVEGWDTAIGTLLVLGAALTFALYQLLAKNLIAGLGSLLFTSVGMSAASLAGLTHYAVTAAQIAPNVSYHYLGLAAATAIFATVVPSFLINAGLGRIGPQATAMISTISPLVTIILAVFFLGEAFTIVDAIGTAMILAGIGFYTWADSRAARA
jgi:drug/metabolite transporter (DMT)-like permease